MQKIIFVSENVRKEVEEYMRSSEGLFCSDYVDYCQNVADEFSIGASDAECIYDDLFVNTRREWECADQYDEDDIKYDEADDYYYVED